MLNVVELSVIILSVVMLNVILLNVIMLSVIILSVVMLNVIMMSVLAPLYLHMFSSLTAKAKPEISTSKASKSNCKTTFFLCHKIS